MEIWEIKQADGELGLRLSVASNEQPYFGVINIGDVSTFKGYLSEHLGIEVQEDNFHTSLFNLIDTPDSSIYLLIGAKRFIEGWSSWRVSSMGLLNIGKGEGPRLSNFWAGVRLKGKNMSLKRSAALQGETPPVGLDVLETLIIFGWNANYIKNFRKILENEDLGKAVYLTRAKMNPWPENKLPVPQKRLDSIH